MVGPAGTLASASVACWVIVICKPDHNVKVAAIGRVSVLKIYFNTIVETETPPATPVKEEHDDDDDTVVMPGVTINLLPSSTESNEKSHSNSTTGMENDADNLGSTQPDLDDSPGEIRVKKVSYL
ncbi:unnamed protein product [Trichobilharzia regenti]|nr:unnamed protein product [Trichobilharzia regenti]